MASNMHIPPFLEAPSTVVGGTPTFVFPIPFPFFAPADIIVLVDGEALAPSAFTVTGYIAQDGQPVVGGYGSGQVVLDVAVSNVTVTIDRFVVGDRKTQFSRSAPLDMSALNGDLNRLTARQQDLARRQAAFDALGLDAAEIAADRAATDEALNLAQQYAADAAQVSGVNVPIYASRASLAGATVAVGVLSVETQGYASAGDGGGARWKRVVSEPSHPGKVVSNGGTVWWEYVPGMQGVDVAAFGAVLDNSTDCAAAINAAAECARSSNRRSLFAQSGLSAFVTGPIDLTGIIRIDFSRCRIRVDADIEDVPVEFGGFANSGLVCDFRFAEVTDGTSEFGAPPGRPIVRAIGVKGSDIRIGTCNYFQLYADESRGADYGSTAYNRVFLDGVQGLVEMTDAGGYSWVNENSFYRGRILRINIEGVDYAHNHNRFYDPALEGSEVEVNFSNCYSNGLFGVRGESVGESAGVTFAADAYANTVILSWSGSGNPQDAFRVTIPVSDAGKGNIVTTESATQFAQTQLFAVSPFAGILSTATDTTAPDPNIAPQDYGFVTAAELGRAVLDPGLNDFGFAAFQFIASTPRIPVVMGQCFPFDADYTGALIRPLVTVYGADGRPLLSEGGLGPYVSFIGMAALNTTYGSYSTDSDLTAAELNATPIVILRDEVKSVQVALFSGTGGRAKLLSLSTFTRNLDQGAAQGAASLKARPLSLDGPPTRGFMPLHTFMFDRAAKVTRWVSLNYETTVNGALSAGATSVTVAAPSTIANGDVVGIVLDNGRTHWTTVSGLSGSTFTIAAVPSGRSVPNGARIVFNRWAS